jgi:lipopolysaccharide/colanic/teichoic acid biosynthesis glycosyltransferase
LFDFELDNISTMKTEVVDATGGIRPSNTFRVVKRVFDVLFCLILIPVFLITATVLLVLNPFLNRGKLFFVQPRMGKDCKAIATFKFRSMNEVQTIKRGAEDPLEVDRISGLGRFLRKSRLDEIPQIINVLKGEMSLIGPRPDYFHHARKYLRTVPGYRARHTVLPGISGLAQTEVGYVAGSEGTARKVRADVHYINNASLALDAWIFWRTVTTVLGRKGA